MKIRFTNLSVDYIKLEFVLAILAGMFLMLGTISWVFDYKPFVLFYAVFAFLMWLSKMLEFAESFEEKRVFNLTDEKKLPFMYRRQAD